MSQQEQRIAREEARLQISETLATATTLHSEGINGKRPIGDYLEYLRLVKACHDRTSDVDNLSIQLIDEFLNKIEKLNVPTSGRMFIKQWGTQILYEKLKATNKLDEYISKLRTFKLDKQVEFERRQEKWNGDRRDNIDLFNVSIQSKILLPYRKRQAEMEYEVFLNSSPMAIRKWIADDDDDDDGARCLDNHDIDGADVLAEDESSANQQTSHLLPKHQHRHHHDYQDSELSKKWKSIRESVKDLDVKDTSAKSTHTSYKSFLKKFSNYCMREGFPTTEKLCFAKKVRGKLILDPVAEDAILGFFMDLILLLKDGKLNWGEKSARAMVQSIQYLVKRHMNKYFKNEDENFFKGRIWHFAAVREFLKAVVEKEGKIITFKVGERGVRVMTGFRDVHSEIHEDIGTDALPSLVLSTNEEQIP